VKLFPMRGGGGGGRKKKKRKVGICIIMWAMVHWVVEIIQDCETCVVLIYLTLFKLIEFTFLQFQLLTSLI
jgi:hypothetical protein